MSEGPAPLSVQLRLVGRRCLVVGAGAVGARRARTLSDAGAVVTVVAPRIGADVAALEAAGRVAVVRREVRAEDLPGVVMVVAATGDAAVDAWVGEEAARHGVLVNRADEASAGEVLFPAVVRRGPLALAVSTGGRAPAVARLLAGLVDDGLDALLDLDEAAVSLLVDVAEEVRSELRRAGEGVTDRTPGAMNWRTALDESILDLIRRGRRAEAKERLLACLWSS